MSNALKVINARANALQKRHPKSKRKTLLKQAGREWKAGKLKGKRKKATAKRKPARRKSAPRKKRVASVGKVKTTRRRRSTAKPKVRVVTRTRTVTKVKRVGASRKDNTMLYLGLGALALGAVYLMTSPKKTVTVPGSSVPLVLTGNTQRDTASQNIVSWATAAVLSATALTNLITAINGASDTKVVTKAQAATSAGDPSSAWGNWA